MKSREQWVAEFLEAGDTKTAAEGGNLMQHTSCFAEELAEFSEAISDYIDNPNEETRAALCKEWADVQVTLSNFAWFFGFNGDEAFFRVAENNLSKIIDGKVVKREDGKILKPEGYQKPDMRGL